jgi:tetratricopeptide (TPR) repeat protein
MRTSLRFCTFAVFASLALVGGRAASGQSPAGPASPMANGGAEFRLAQAAPLVIPKPGQSATSPSGPVKAVPQALRQADVAAPQQHLLDELFGRLSKSTDTQESQGIAGAIERLWMRSGSDTADLLMGRALTAVQGKQLPLAEKLLGSVIAVEPEWAEAWNKRATVRFMNDDDAGAMQDIAEVLRREPRHFGALVGMATILQRAGLKKAALKVFRKALDVYPQQSSVRTLVDKLTLDVEGRDI